MEIVRNAGVIEIPQTTLTPAAEQFLLLDSVGTASTAAWSTRRISEAYAGDCMRVRAPSNATPDLEADIPFSGNDLDTAFLLTHCNGGDGFVVTWYDQSGNSRDMTQATAANQPQIVSAGSVIVTINGKPSIQFLDATSLLSTATLADVFNADAYTLLFSSRPTAGGTGDTAAYNEREMFGDAGISYVTQGWGNTKFIAGHFGSVDRDLRVNATYPNVYVSISRYDNVEISGFLNGGSPTTNVTTDDVAVLTGAIRLSRVISDRFVGTMAEAALYDVALSDANLNTLGTNMTAYNGATWTNI